MFSVGEEICCINDDQPPQSAPPFVIKGRTYTVARVESKWWPIDSVTFGDGNSVAIYQAMEMVWVVGLPSETGHFDFRFEKVQKKSKETSIEVFKEILKTTKVPERIA